MHLTLSSVTSTSLLLGNARKNTSSGNADIFGTINISSTRSTALYMRGITLNTIMIHLNGSFSQSDFQIAVRKEHCTAKLLLYFRKKTVLWPKMKVPVWLRESASKWINASEWKVKGVSIWASEWMIECESKGLRNEFVRVNEWVRREVVEERER